MSTQQAENASPVEEAVRLFREAKQNWHNGVRATALTIMHDVAKAAAASGLNVSSSCDRYHISLMDGPVLWLLFNPDNFQIEIVDPSDAQSVVDHPVHFEARNHRWVNNRFDSEDTDPVVIIARAIAYHLFQRLMPIYEGEALSTEPVPPTEVKEPASTPEQITAWQRLTPAAS